MSPILFVLRSEKKCNKFKITFHSIIRMTVKLSAELMTGCVCMRVNLQVRVHSF